MIIRVFPQSLMPLRGRDELQTKVLPSAQEPTRPACRAGVTLGLRGLTFGKGNRRIMDNRPIGVFDSGLGGLTAVRELAALLPHEQLIYFGDTGRVPYGGRSQDTIIRYARQDVAFLRSFDLKAIVVACGTVSTTALPILRQEQDLPIFGVVEPTARQAAEATRNGKIGLIATRASIRTGAYQAAITGLRPEAQVSALACPLFVPLVENGRTQPGDVVIETVAAEYLAPLKAEGVDTLVLGCTHYPLLKEVIRNFMGTGVTLVDSGAAVAQQLCDYLRERSLAAEQSQSGACRWYVSDSTEGFAPLASRFLGRPVTEPVEQVSLEGE